MRYSPSPPRWRGHIECMAWSLRQRCYTSCRESWRLAKFTPRGDGQIPMTCTQRPSGMKETIDHAFHLGTHLLSSTSVLRSTLLNLVDQPPRGWYLRRDKWASEWHETWVPASLSPILSHYQHLKWCFDSDKEVTHSVVTWEHSRIPDLLLLVRCLQASSKLQRFHFSRVIAKIVEGILFRDIILSNG